MHRKAEPSICASTLDARYQIKRNPDPLISLRQDEFVRIYDVANTFAELILCGIGMFVPQTFRKFRDALGQGNYHLRLLELRKPQSETQVNGSVPPLSIIEWRLKPYFPSLDRFLNLWS